MRGFEGSEYSRDKSSCLGSEQVRNVFQRLQDITARPPNRFCGPRGLLKISDPLGQSPTSSKSLHEGNVVGSVRPRAKPTATSNFCDGPAGRGDHLPALVPGQYDRFRSDALRQRLGAPSHARFFWHGVQRNVTPVRNPVDRDGRALRRGKAVTVCDVHARVRRQVADLHVSIMRRRNGLLDIIVQARRGKDAALRPMRKLLKNQGLVPTPVVTDRYRLPPLRLNCKRWASTGWTSRLTPSILPFATRLH